MRKLLAVLIALIPLAVLAAEDVTQFVSANGHGTATWTALAKNEAVRRAYLGGD